MKEQEDKQELLRRLIEVWYMIKITFTPKKYAVDIKGHAECGEKGNDIVCSAVSALFYTLGQCLYESKGMLTEEPTFTDKDGEGHLSCVPKAEYEGNIARSYWTIMQGFMLISGNFPDNVKIFIK